MTRPRIRRWSSWLSGAVLAAGAAAMVIAAVVANGLPVREVEFNDGGIWVTSDADGLFGRLNRPAGALDAIFYPPGGARSAYTLDVLQDGSAVAAWDKSAGKLFPVDVARGATAGATGLDVAPSTQVALSGGTIALLEPATGQLRAMRASPGHGLASLGQLDPASEPVASIGPDAVGDGTQTPDTPPEQPDRAAGAAALAVSTDGTIFAVSAAGRVASVHPDGAGGFADASYSDLGRALTEPRATTVGERLVVLDEGGRLVLPGGGTVDVGDSAVLQQPGPAASEVLVATDGELLGVDLDGGQVRTLGAEGNGTPAAPVRLGVCIHAAWAGTGGGYYRSCDGGAVAKANLDDAQRLVAPVFRVNRGAIVLNDLTTGAVWDLADQRRVDDWSSVRPPPAPDDSENSQTRTDPQVLLARPPKAVDDVLGARPGRTTLLYVLDNDSDPAGSILSIVEVSPPSVDSATLAISPDGQTVAITVTEQSAPIQFTYTIDDGAQTAQASVTVQVRRPDENRSPQPRVGYEPPTLTVPSGGQLSVPVLADWRDFDGDPIALVDASATGGVVSARPDGRLDFTAPVPGGVQTLTYKVGDGLGEATAGSISVNVQPPKATAGVAPITQPDVARGQVGDPITLRPLDNDLPGSDPTNRDAVLALAGEVASPANATVVTNLRTGVVVVTAARPGAYLMEYTAAFGNAPFAKGSIRVDVVPVPDSPNPPVAMPDQALLHGQVPTTVDVLANDFDPAGGVLVVQRAAPVEADSGLQVAIVDGKWVRISALAAFTNSQPKIVRYTITNGVTGPVAGEITVSRLPDSASTVPVPVDDVAVVRAGDTVTVAVLDNDSNPAGAAMSLASNVVGAPGPGRLVIESRDVEDVGAAYVTGDLVRYVAPAAVEEVVTVVVQYVVRNAAGDSAVGQLRITVNPAPGEQQANRPPAPVPLEARVVSGQTVTIDIPTSGVDGDGDSVTLIGLDSAPTLGRVVRQNATSLTYLAYPTSTGTDTFEYRVRDRFGATGTATIRVGVIPPGPPQPPVAVDDHITAAPGARLHVDVLANDLIASGDVVGIEPLAERNPDLGADVVLAGPQGPIDMAAPDLSGKPRLVAYAISNGIGEPSMATVTVRAQEGYNNPPVVYDAHPSTGPQDQAVTVDVLERGFDPDGERADLRVTSVFDSRAAVSGTVVTLPVMDSPYTVAYELADAGGATAVGLIHVPAPGSGAPYVRPGARIEVDRDGTKSIDINDYVVSPRERPVRLTTTNRIWASPPGGLSAVDEGQDAIELTGLNGYAGPGALTFEVTDGDSLTDPEARTAVVTIPVQVGEVTPVLHCPEEPLSVVEGGDELRIDVTSVCYVWVDGDRGRGDLRYTASWDGSADGLNLDGSGSQTLRVSASSGTAPGTVGVLTIGIDGTGAVPDRLRIRVDPAPPLAIAAMFVDGVKAGDTTTVDVARFVRSRLRNPEFSVVQVAQTAGMTATASTSGTAVSITPDAAAHGEMRFDVTVTDVADQSRSDRHVVGQIRLNVLGVPDAPGQPQLGAEVLSRSVELSWTAPANNGAPIEEYEVAWSGGSQPCAASPCLITGLTNGRTYTFTVRARNLVGWSPPSPSSPRATPDTVPGAVTGIVVSQPQDGSLLLTWEEPANEGTAIQYYDVLWSGGGADRATGTQLRADGLDNNTVYTFTIVAVNARGPGPSAQVQGQSAGAPPRPAAPSFTSVNLAGSTTRAVTVSWPAVDPNGWNPVTYTLTRTGKGTVTVCADVTATSCQDDGISNDGTIYTYTLVAENAAAAQGPGHTSPASPGAQMEAAATPEPITNVSIQPTGVNGQATISFDVGASHGASNTVTCMVGGNSCGTWTFPVGGQSGVTRTINGLPNGTAVTANLRACNGSSGGAGAGSPCNSTVGATVTAYGPLGSPTITTSTSGQTVFFTVSVNPNGKPATVRVTTNYGTDQMFTTGVGSWSWSSSNTPGYSRTVTINVTVSDPDGVRTPTTGQASRTTGPAPPPPPPPPPPSVSLSVGSGGGGAMYSVTLNNFPANSVVTVGCYDENNGRWGTGTITTNSSGNGSNPSLCGPLFESGENHWVIANGVQSNVVHF